MQTLLEKVKTIESEAAAVIAQAEQQGRQAMADTLNREPKVLAEVKDRATKQGQAIVKEAIAQAQTESAKILQAESITINGIKKLAQKNTAATLQLAQELFTQDYIN
ncbi:MAG: hypothetical protein HYZ63_00430 [Candidatus Andersenbacteria bacterium]|nr:hypothetical protein [Candidatus Andersenbacteria bacterium]